MHKPKKIINGALLFSLVMIILGAFSQTALAQTPQLQATKKSDQIYINVGRAQLKKSLVAMPGIQTQKNTSAFKKAKDLIQHTIEKDLNFSNYFKFIPASSFLEKPGSVSYLPKNLSPKGFDFQKWKDINAEFLIQGNIKSHGKNTTAHMYLYYIPQNKLVFEKEYTAPSTFPQEIGHDFSNDVMKKLTGLPSIFKTKILVSSDRAGKGLKEIFSMNWDGSQVQKVTNHKSITLSPSWSPGGNQIAYSAFTIDPRKGHRNANLYVYDLRTKKRVLVSSRTGINSGSAFLPHGRSLLMTLSATGTPDIYKIGLNGKVESRITSGPFGAMNVEPALSPDGKTIAFSSDRSGRPMIYTMGIEPITPARRITKAGRYNSTPSFSPDGKKIAFAGWDKDHFDIFVMNPDGTNLKRLTQDRRSNGKWSSNESPSFSPDGRFIVFTSNRTGRKQLFITNIEGNITVPITKDNFNYFQPKWSPFL